MNATQTNLIVPATEAEWLEQESDGEPGIIFPRSLMFEAGFYAGIGFWLATMVLGAALGILGAILWTVAG